MTNEEVRRYQDPETGKQWFSMVDIIALTTSSKNPQNYWKVLKSRLKKSAPELVTKCNQLKMKAKDGKYYLTDAADVETLTEIIKLIPGANVHSLEECVAPFVTTPPTPTPSSVSPKGGEELPSPSERVRERSEVPTSEGVGTPTESVGAELLLDAYESGNYIFIEAFIAGVSLEDLNIDVEPRKIIIEGKRTRSGDDYFTQELQWLSFSRTLDLPAPVDTERAEATERDGHLTIRLPKVIVQ
ncbi:MAG: Hsp20/alpha crystallin family protein [Patescibacteria group bacterium]